MAKNRKTPDMNLPVWFDGQNINEAMKILVFYVDKQYFNMVILFLRLRVRRELIIRRDGRAVEGTGLENRRGFTPSVSSNLTSSAIKFKKSLSRKI